MRLLALARSNWYQLYSRVPTTYALYRTQEYVSSTQRRRFSELLVHSKEELLRQLKTLPNSGEIPIHFGADARSVAQGKKRLLAEDDTFRFTCTHCGACCRSYPASVVLDSYDIWLMSRSPSLWEGINSPRSTQLLHEQYSTAFRFVLGEFGAQRYAPVCMLTSKHRTTKRGDSKRITSQCHFAYPALQRTSEGGGPTYFSYREARDKSSSESTRYLCGLGTSHQPMACVQYPLGELYTPVGEGPSFYSLDHRGCEGVDGPTAGGGTTVRRYREDRGLPFRRAQWDWFRGLVARHIAEQRLVHRLHSADPTGVSANGVLSVFQTLLYNYEALRGFADWCEARQFVEQGCSAVAAEAEGLLEQAGPAAAVRLVERLVATGWAVQGLADDLAELAQRTVQRGKGQKERA